MDLSIKFPKLFNNETVRNTIGNVANQGIQKIFNSAANTKAGQFFGADNIRNMGNTFQNNINPYVNQAADTMANTGRNIYNHGNQFVQQQLDRPLGGGYKARDLFNPRQREAMGQNAFNYAKNGMNQGIDYVANSRGGQFMGSNNVRNAIKTMGGNLAQGGTGLLRRQKSNFQNVSQNMPQDMPQFNTGGMVSPGRLMANSLSFQNLPAVKKASPLNQGASMNNMGVLRYAKGGRVCVSPKEQRKFEGGAMSSKMQHFMNCFK